MHQCLHRIIGRAPRLIALALAAVVMLAGCGSDEVTSEPETSLLPMTVVEWLFAPGVNPVVADPIGLMHVSWDPMSTGENRIEIEVTDLFGEPLPDISASTDLTLTVRQLTPEATPTDLELARDADTWTASAVDLAETGWYQLDVALSDAGDVWAIGHTWALLPDPSVYGADAIDLPDSDPEAEALYQRALERYASWETARWREGLSSGAGAVVVTGFTVTDIPGQPPAMRVDSRYVGAFRDRADGSPASPARIDFGSRIVIGDQGWLRDADDRWLESPVRPSSTFEERADVYSGATNVLPGGTAEVAGVQTEIVTFYLPEKQGQSEAWFVWWIDPETGNLLQAMMIAQMHYMVWNIDSIDADIAIERPSVDTGATPEPVD